MAEKLYVRDWDEPGYSLVCNGDPYGEDYEILARCGDHDDAVLFAAAPELLETLGWLAAVLGNDHPSDWDDDSVAEIETRITSAIAKAKGGA